MNKEIIPEFEQSISQMEGSSKVFVDKSLMIVTRIHAIMKQKGIKQEELATRMGKHRESISRFLNPMYNFTLRTLSEIEAALGEEIINIKGIENQNNLLP